MTGQSDRFAAARPFFARLTRIWSTLFVGSVAAQLLNLGALVIAARVLPLELVGGIAVIQAAARLCQMGLGVDTNVATLTHSARFQAAGDRAGFVGLLKACLAVEVAGSLIAAAATFAVLSAFAAELGVSEGLRDIAPVYALVALFTLHGFHMTVLRSFERFDVIAISDATSGAVRVGGAAICAVSGAGPVWYVLAWLIADLLAQGLPLLFSFLLLRRKGYPALISARAWAATRASPGYWRMVLTSNAATTLRGFSEQGDVVLAGWLAGPAVAGLYRIAKSCAAPAKLITQPIRQAAMPELTRLYAEGAYQRFYRYGLAYSAVGGAVGLACLLGAWAFAPWIIWLIAGSGVEGAAPVFVALVGAYALLNLMAASVPMASALDRMGLFLGAQAAATSAFLAISWTAAPVWGALGVAAGVLAQNVVYIVGVGLIAFGWRKR